MIFEFSRFAVSNGSKFEAWSRDHTTKGLASRETRARDATSGPDIRLLSALQWHLFEEGFRFCLYTALLYAFQNFVGYCESNLESCYTMRIVHGMPTATLACNTGCVPLQRCQSPIY